VGILLKHGPVRVIALNDAPGMGFHSREVARVLFTSETTTVARPNQPFLYFFQCNKLAPGYGRLTGFKKVEGSVPVMPEAECQ
jgi:hypothetical protein